MTGRTIKSILFLNKQGFFNHYYIFKKFLLILRQDSAQIDKKAMTIKKFYKIAAAGRRKYNNFIS